ncbi:MAG: ADP-ribosylation factor-like protein [Candidatus Hodarchaeales archaeon]|jgi:Ras-related GTP-binding protein A/B
MSRWVSESEISQQLGYKILIAGLSEAGKTAVKRIFFLKQQTEDVNKLSATINYERLSLTVNDVPVSIVDLGGQKIFLKRFLSGFSPFIFSNVKIFIFLIDVANKTSRNNSIQYFIACLEKLKKFSPESNIFVFLHKNDLIRNSPNYESIHEQFKEQFQIESSQRIKFFRTTIFRPESVIDAFGRILELSIQELAQSDFVKGRLIGKIEEHHEIAMTLSEKTEPAISVTQTRLTPKPKDEDSAALEKLRFIMKQSLKTSNDVPTESNVFLGSAASEESISEASLTHRGSISEEIETISTSPPHKDISVEVEPQIPPSTNMDEIHHLIEFYRISVEEAKALVNSGWNQLFEMGVTSGMPVPLVSDIFLKYLPFIEKSQGEDKFRTIDHNKLLGLFSMIIRGDLREEDIVKSLVIATEKPQINMKEIVQNYIVPKEVVQREEKEEIKKSPEFTQLNVPVETESNEGVIALPNTQGMGFKVDLVDDGLNALISFQLRSSMGQKELIGSSLISSEANEEEILYLLAYEKNLMSIGVFEDGISSMYFAAKIIFESIRQLKARKINSTKDVTPKRIRDETGVRTDLVEYIIPVELETRGDYLLLPDSEIVAFNLESVEKGLILSFTQRGFPIGQAHISEMISELQLERLLKEAMQIPIDSEESVRFASRIIYASIRTILQAKEISEPQTIIKHEERKEESSNQLKEYLNLLMDDDNPF